MWELVMGCDGEAHPTYLPTPFCDHYLTEGLPGSGTGSFRVSFGTYPRVCIHTVTPVSVNVILLERIERRGTVGGDRPESSRTLV